MQASSGFGEACCTLADARAAVPAAQEYLGSYVSDESGRLVFREGLLVQAVRQGHWIVLDELNLAPTEVLEALNRWGRTLAAAAGAAALAAARKLEEQLGCSRSTFAAAHCICAL